MWGVGVWGQEKVEEGMGMGMGMGIGMGMGMGIVVSVIHMTIGSIVPDIMIWDPPQSSSNMHPPILHWNSN